MTIMMRLTPATKERILQWTHELLFSMNCAWMMVWVNRQRERPWIFPWTEQVPFLLRWYRHIHLIEPTSVLEQVVWSILAGVVIWIVLRLLARFILTRIVLRDFAGPFALAGFPFFALCFSGAFFNPPRISTHGTLLLLETVAVLICGILYSLRKWPLPVPLNIFFLFLHFGLWAWVTGNYIDPSLQIRSYGLWSIGIWISTLYVAVNFLTDLLYSAVNPRIRQ